MGSSPSAAAAAAAQPAERTARSPAEMMADSPRFRRLTGVLLAVTVVFGVGAVVFFAPGARPMEVALVWALYALSLAALARVPAARRAGALLVNGLLLQTAALFTAWLQGWGLDGGSLLFIAPTGLILGALLPPRAGCMLWLHGVSGTVLLALAPRSGLPMTALPEVSLLGPLSNPPPEMLKLILLLSSQSLAFVMGRALGWLFQEQIQRESQAVARYRHFFEQVPVAVLVHRRGVVLDANAFAATLLGFPDRQALVGVSLTAAAAAEVDAEFLKNRVGRIEKLPVGSHLEPATVRLRTQQGRLLDCQVVCSRVSLPDGPANIAMLTDETLRLGMEASLRWSLSLQRQLVASGPMAIWVRHLGSGRTINTNEAAAQLSGYTLAELVAGVAQGRAIPWTEPDTWATVEQPLLQDSGPVSRTLSLSTRQGQIRTVRAWASAFEVDGDPYAVWFAQDITRELAERAEHEAVMERARAAAEAASRAKTAFLANTSHELRTPLNAVIGLSRLALAPGLSEEQRLRHLRQIQDSSLLLSSIVNEVLDLAKIESGRLQIERTRFDLDALSAALADTYSTLAEAKGLRFERRVSWAGPQWVEGDPTRVRQILLKLLGNALKFTEQGQIRLSLRRLSATHVCLEVQDSGVGVPIEAQELIFQPFAQADTSTTRRFGGTGLGLSIVRELCQLMGGMCEVSSNPGQGSRFWCVLELPATAATEVHGEADGGADGGAPAAAALAGLRVLVVEDNPINRMIIILMLEQQGAQVVTANDGREAMQRLAQDTRDAKLPDAVILDMQMPEMDGKATAQAIRADARLRHLPLMALTAGITPEEREEALASGVDDYLTKPIDLDELTRRLLRRVRHSAPASPASPA